MGDTMGEHLGDFLDGTTSLPFGAGGFSLGGDGEAFDPIKVGNVNDSDFDSVVAVVSILLGSDAGSFAPCIESKLNKSPAFRYSSTIVS